MTASFLFAGDNVGSDLILPLVHLADDIINVDVVVERTDKIPEQELSTVFHQNRLNGGTWAFGSLKDGSGWGFDFGRGCSGRMEPDLSHITLFALPDAPAEWLCEAVVGWALVFRLAVSGRSTFHGSAVSLDGSRAVAILGPSESGKSTLAAATLALGGSLLGDDVLAPILVDGRFVVQSTASALKLRGTAQLLDTHLGEDGTLTFDDRLRVQSRRSPDQLPLSRLYFISPGEPAGIRRIDPSDVVVRLIAESKVGHWMLDEQREQEFLAACEIADQVPGFVLGRSQTSEAISPEALIDTALSLFTE